MQQCWQSLVQILGETPEILDFKYAVYYSVI